MTRVSEYLRYHQESARIGDIDPSYEMLRYVCDRFELTEEQRYWLAFVYALTYCGASTFYVYNEFPDFENLDSGRLNRWWYDRDGRENIICQTDRRWCRSSNQFVSAVECYRRWVGDKSQAEFFRSVATGDSPEERYDNLYSEASDLYTFGQFTLFLYLEALHVITPLDLCPTDLDLNKAWSCRNGLYYAYGMDDLVDDTESRIRPEAVEITDQKWRELKSTLSSLEQSPTVWQTETVLCAYRKWHRGKRYVGYYLDRQAVEIAKMEYNVQTGVCWDVLWEFRRETLKSEYLVENTISVDRLSRGLPSAWKNHAADRTRRSIE